jgi:PhnB protein
MAVNPIPPGQAAVTPYIISKDVDKLLRFVKTVFNAEVKEEHRTPDGTVMHADVTIGGAHIMMGHAGGQWSEKLGSILVYVPDADATYRAALEAGGTSIYEMTTHFYGDRSGGVEDPAGVTWWISTHVEDVPPDELERRMKAQRG